MKKWMAVIAVCCIVAQAMAAEWLTDLPKALALAKADKKMVFMAFRGSDWCPDCMALEKRILSTPEFAKYASNNLVLVDVDFPHKKTQTEELKKANDELAKKYEIKGYPTLIVLDADGGLLTRELSYDGESPKKFVAKLEKLKKQP